MRNGAKVLSMALAFLLAAVGVASAANCGNGVKVCECGDTVVTDTTLVVGTDPVVFDSNVGDICVGTDGLIIDGGITLDIDHGSIIGDNSAGTVGIRFAGNDNRVQNGAISGFEVGVGGTTVGQLPGCTNCPTLNDMQLTGNVTGILITASNALFDTNVASGNEGDGINVTGSFNKIIDHHEATGNGGNGIVVTGNSNFIENSSVSGNGLDGIDVVGNTNTATTNQVFSNSGDGISVAGNKNTVKGNDVGELDKGNGEAGIRIAGRGNTVRENHVYANGTDGIDVSGGVPSSVNVVVKNNVGDRGKGNLSNGIVIQDTGNGTSSPIEVDSNIVRSNGATGILVRTVATGTTTAAVSPASTTVPIGVNPTSLGFATSGQAVLGGIDTFNYTGVNSTGFTGVTGIGQSFPIGTAVTGNSTKGHQLKNNVSGGTGDQVNLQCQYDVGPNNFNATGNKSNGVLVQPNVNGKPFPTGCLN